MRDVAVVSFAQTATRRDETRNEVEILLPVVAEAMKPTGLTTHDIGFTVSGQTASFRNLRVWEAKDVPR